MTYILDLVKVGVITDRFWSCSIGLVSSINHGKPVTILDIFVLLIHIVITAVIHMIIITNLGCL